MKQNINPKLAIAVVVGALIIVGISVLQALRGPSVAAPTNQKPIPRADMDKMMRDGHEQYMQFKRNRPAANTR